MRAVKSSLLALEKRGYSGLMHSRNHETDAAVVNGLTGGALQ